MEDELSIYDALPETHQAAEDNPADEDNTTNSHNLRLDTFRTVAPLARLIELRNKRLTYKEIGAIIGVSEQAVYQRLSIFKPSVDNLDSVKANRADTFAVVGDGLLNSLSEDDVKSASLLQRVTAVGILYDKERLERGQSTANISVVDLTLSLAEITRQREDLERQVVGARDELSELIDGSEVIDV